MKWMLFGVASPAVFALVNHLDAHIVGKQVKGPAAMPLYTAIVVFALSVIAFLVAGLPNLGLAGAALAFSGFILMMAYVFYFRAIAVGDPAFVAAMIQVSAVFTLALSIVFLDERLSAARWVGFFLIMGAALALSLESVEGRLRLGQAFWPMIMADLCWAVAAVIVKRAFTTRTFLPVVAYEGFGVALGGAAIALSPVVRQAFRTSLRESGRRVILLVFANEGLGFLGKALFFVGVSLGPVAIVSAMGGVQPLFSLAYGYLLAALLPHVFPRPQGGAHLLRRLGLSVLLVAGMWLCR
jgi:drug/metabolite transporter (DMT)-like permease